MASSALQKLKQQKGKTVKTKPKAKPNLKAVKADKPAAKPAKKESKAAETKVTKKTAAPKKEAKKPEAKKETKKIAKRQEPEAPTTAEIKNMNMKELDAVYADFSDQFEEEIDDWDEYGLEQKREALAEHMEVLAEAVLVDWRGVFDGDKPVQATYQNKLAMLTGYEPSREFVSEESQNIENWSAEALAEDAEEFQGQR